MKLRRFQYSTSTDMSGARTNPVLRRDMPMRQPVLRNVSNYLRDPKAGQRDMNLEVAAAGRGKYLANAISKGMMELGETLAAAEASALATNELMDFKTQLAVAEVNAKGRPLTRTQSYLDPSSGSNKTREIATHQNLVPTFDEATKGIIDSASNRLPLAVRNQFRAQALNLGAAARDRVVNMAIKKQIEFGKHTIFSAIRKANTQADVEKEINSAHAQLYFSATELNTIYEEKMKELAIRDYATQIVLAANSGPGARGNLRAIQERVIDGTIQVQVTNKLGEVLYEFNAKGELVPQTTAGTDPLHRFLGGENILKLHNKIVAIGKEMDAVSEKAREDEVNMILNDITATAGNFSNASEAMQKRYKNKDGTWKFGNNWSDIIQYMVDGSSASILEGSDITTLMARLKAAREGDIVQPVVYGDILENLEQYATKEGRDLIRRMNGLDINQIQDLQERSRNMERAGENWWEKDNPFNNRGHIAVMALKGHFDLVETPDSGVFAKFSTKEKASAVHQAYQTLLRELHDYVDSIDDVRLKPEKALEWVYEKIDEDNKAGRPLATGGQTKKAGGKAGGSTGTSMDDSPKVTITTPEGTTVGSSTQTTAQSDAKKVWDKTPGAKDEQGNVWTPAKVAALPAGPKRDGLAVVLEAHGIVIPPAIQQKSKGLIEEKKPDNPNLPRWGIWPPSELPSNPFDLGYHYRIRGH